MECHRLLQTIWIIAIALGYSSELDSETLLLKAPAIGVTGHGETKLAPAGKLHLLDSFHNAGRGYAHYLRVWEEA